MHRHLNLAIIYQSPVIPVVDIRGHVMTATNSDKVQTAQIDRHGLRGAVGMIIVQILQSETSESFHAGSASMVSGHRAVMVYLSFMLCAFHF